MNSQLLGEVMEIRSQQDKADLIASFIKTGYTPELATQIANLFSSKTNRKETEHDGNNQRTDNGSIK